MSRKSLSKKEPALWYLCNSCNFNIFAKDREGHLCVEQSNSELTQKNCTFVCNNKLSTNQLAEKQITDDLKGINQNKLNCLIFLHESIFPLCDLVLGDYVLVASTRLTKNVPIVRIAWPMTSSAQGVVCVSEEGNLTFCQYFYLNSKLHSFIFHISVKFQSFERHGNPPLT